VNAHKRPTLDFAPSSPWKGLVVFLVLYLVPGLFATAIIMADNRAAAIEARWTIGQALGVLALYLMIGYFLVLHLVFGAQRFRFHEQHFDVLTWRGWQRYEWRKLKRVVLSSVRGNIELVLFVDGLRRVSVLLNGFDKRRSLIEAVRVRVAVPIEAAPAVLASVEDL
jgi:hypothetical protein